MCAQNMHTQDSSYKIAVETETETELREIIKSATLFAVEKPHTLDHSNKELANFSKSLSMEHIVSSKVLLLRSSHTIHIKHRGARFQISE
jgi:hemin uptake protein HemP